MSENDKDAGNPLYTTVRVYEDGTMTINEAAKVLHVSSMTVREWIKKGMRVAVDGGGKKGSAARIMLKDVLDFKASPPDEDFSGEDGEVYNLEKAKARRAHMLADIEQMKRDREALRTVLIDDVADIVETDYTAVRAGVLGLAAKMCMKLSTLKDTREIYEYVRAECVEVLEEMTKPDDVPVKITDKKRSENGLADLDDDDGADDEDFE